VPFVWIVLVAWSRIYLGVHAPLDVVGGFVLGLLVVLLAEKIPWPKRKKA
jgi:membrane-associated phospholipid phosphatase